MCLAQGRTEPAVEVDHIKPLALGGLDVDENTRNLCEPHHRAVTAEQFAFDVAAGGRGVDVAGRPTGPDHPWSAANRGGDPGGGSKLQRSSARTPVRPSVHTESGFKVKSSG
ncbi:HNH endonuclease [Sphingosinithalassobacter tenebrarum]|uniref:HNH endonuclease n=1 Tax=Stakelama tenebrarum TaxID=2711215 RepID=A0A6G6YAC9_9SPHN|nr:HNH endonuclease [Sphingosinithalassobacter tenebrarum]